MSQHGTTSPLTVPLTSPGTASLEMARMAGGGWPAMLLVGLGLVAGLIGAGLLAAVLAWSADGAAYSLWSLPALLTAVLVAAIVAVSIWIRMLSRPLAIFDPDPGRDMASDRAGGEAMERDLAPLRDLASSLSRMVRDGAAAMDAARGHSAEAVDAALRATARLAGNALDAEERLRVTVLRAERLQAGAWSQPGQIPTQPDDLNIVSMAQAVEATRRANQQAERLERVIPELMLAVAHLSQSEAANASHTARRLDAVLAGLDHGAASLEMHTNAIAAATEQAGVMIASLPEAASLVNAAAARLTQDSAGIAAALDQGAAAIAALPGAAALLHAAAARLAEAGDAAMDTLRRGADDFAGQAAALAAAHDQTAMMLDALPEATLLVHAAADRLAADDGRSAQLLERLTDMVLQNGDVLDLRRNAA